MADKVACNKCGNMILLTTARKNDGLCMPCKNGYRDQIEQAKQYYAKERELEKTCPFRALWRELVRKVHDEHYGFENLTEVEKQYFAVRVLNGEVYNGGFIQFFENSSGNYYMYAELGLLRIGAKESLRILRRAREITFGKQTVPTDRAKRWENTELPGVQEALNELDTKFYECSDDVGRLLDLFALETRLVNNA